MLVIVMMLTMMKMMMMTHLKGGKDGMVRGTCSASIALPRPTIVRTFATSYTRELKLLLLEEVDLMKVFHGNASVWPAVCLPSKIDKHFMKINMSGFELTIVTLDKNPNMFI